MAKLGSTVDARLSRISPYAIRAIEMGGAARGAGYAALGTGLGKAITSIMHQTEESRIDEILNEALMPQEGELRNVGDDTMEILKPVKGTGHQPYTPVLDSEGKPTTYSQLDEKAIRRFLSDKKVFGRNISEKRIASFLKQESDAIDSNNTTQLAVKTFEETINANKATIDYREAVEATRLAGEATRLAEVEKATTLATQRHGELLAKAEQTYELESKRYDEVIADRAATAAERKAAANKKLEAEQKRDTNEAILKSISNQMDEKDDFGNPLLSAEDYLNLADKMEKMVLEGEIIDPGLITAAGTMSIRGNRVGYDMQKLAEADAGGVVDEPWEVKLENAGNQMRKTLESQLLPDQLGKYRGYLQDGQETEASRGFLGNLKNQLEAQGGKLRSGSGEQMVRDSVDLYLTTFENPDVSLGKVTPSYQTDVEKIEQKHQYTMQPGFPWATSIKD